MTFSQADKEQIACTIARCLREKFSKPNREPSYTPFHTGLLGADRLALYKFIHSLNTRFGTAIYEPVAKKLAEKKFPEIASQYVLPKVISERCRNVITGIVDSLKAGEVVPDKLREIEAIKDAYGEGGDDKPTKPTLADLYLGDEKNIYLVDIKTPKPNNANFKDMKRTLLEWVAVMIPESSAKEIHSFVAMPYNPYSPKPYERWTMKGMLDRKNELKVAEEFWDFIGGEGAYEMVLGCFERVGISMREEIDDYFGRFNTGR